ncbi:DUF4402 domain-containing protein [Novosphingobium sp. SL115]|uniref:DUF4402 domain-containing protein n=1 Tax=Novosphingobium sp. SL115 TaxID=2995150 RepID=UPI0022723922|nr:DUF4402 domain-containing protein [Novosphingobium sp. SL115]MCY1669501.1 DUF4402 domain-containing protein [Novosphingobium sp. SL115]
MSHPQIRTVLAMRVERLFLQAGYDSLAAFRHLLPRPTGSQLYRLGAIASSACLPAAHAFGRISQRARNLAGIASLIGFAAGMLGIALLNSTTSHAKTPEILVTSDLPLRFGTLLVPSAGSRTIGSSGTVQDSGVFQIGNDPVGPAQFTVTYDRGNEGNRTINVVIQLVVNANQKVRVGAVEGQLSQLESDARTPSGATGGALATFTLANCRERRCSRTIRIGGRLDLSRTAGGAQLVVPLAASAILLDVY